MPSFFNFAFSLIAVLSVWNASICLELLLLFGVTDPTVHSRAAAHWANTSLFIIISYLLSVISIVIIIVVIIIILRACSFSIGNIVCKGCTGEIRKSWSQAEKSVESSRHESSFYSFSIAVNTHRIGSYII